MTEQAVTPVDEIERLSRMLLALCTAAHWFDTKTQDRHLSGKPFYKKKSLFFSARSSRASMAATLASATPNKEGQSQIKQYRRRESREERASAAMTTGEETRFLE